MQRDGHVRLLPLHVANKIAAGEVVERPASVAKELLENAIDAGASAIVTELENGGLTYLRFTDNGCGIAPEQLPVAFLRHATSKLRKAEDLGAIGTLGFRGEALAAISAVSRVDIFSRERGAAEGASLHLDGGIAGEVTPVGCPEGTTICVRDLFFNMPARMKFMKKDSAEATAVAGIVTHLSLSHPDISFKLLRDGQELLHTPGDGKLLSAIYAAMGRDFAMSLVPVSGCGGEIRVEGFATKPLAAHGTRGRQVFFINGRFVKSQILTAALEEAYKNRLMKGKFPGCVLHITLPASAVDVNVHPAKTMVKFVSDNAIFEAVSHIVSDALDAADRPQQTPKQETPFYQTMTAREYRTRAANEAETHTKQPVGSYTVKTDRTTSDAQTLYVHDVTNTPDEPSTAPTADEKVHYLITPPQAVTSSAPPPDFVQERIAPTDAAQETIEPRRETPWRIAGEVLKTYIVCEDENENVWLIDKHAAHERIRFDLLKERREPLMAQTLLTPVAVELDADGYDAVLQNLPLLREFAFACEDFGGGTVLVREVPSDICAEDTAATLEELARKLALGHADPAAARDELLHTVACKSAIKAGMTTSGAELAALVAQVQSGAVRYCPHGRPVKYKLTKYEIEKLFKRV